MLSGDEIYQLVVVVAALVAFVAVLMAANLGESHPNWAVVAYAGTAGLCTIVALLAALNLLAAGSGLTSGGVSSDRTILGNLLQLAGAVVAPLLMLPAARQAVGRVLHRFRPESAVNAVGLSMYVLVLTLFLSLQIYTDQIQAIKQSGSSPSLVFIISTNQLPFFIVALFGVGLVVRRSPGQVLQRLGLYWPGWRMLGVAAGVAVALVIFGVMFDMLITRLTPEQSKNIEEVSKQLLNNVTTPGAAVVLALAAGIGEETLFRGALQPRLGIVAGALLFAVLHTQYAISLASAEIFILGIALGILRNRAGTTGAIIAHTGYDLILLMVPFLVHK